MEIIKVKQVSKSFKRPKIALTDMTLMQKAKHLLLPQYETFDAIKNISFSIKKGEFVGFVGANGSGKSTSIKSLTGILTPDSGSIEIFGLIPWKKRQEYTQRIGVVLGQKSLLWWNLPVQDSFKLYRDIYQISPGKYKLRLKKLTELLGMYDFLHIPVSKLSLGQRMRAEIAASILHSPEIIFLDEPTLGLDPCSRDKLMRFLTLLNKEEAVTVLMSSQNMKDVQDTCARSIIMDKGQIIFDGKTQQLMAFEQYKTLEFDTVPHGHLLSLPDMPYEKIDENRYRIRLSSDSAVIQNLLTNKNIVNLNIMPPTLDETIKGYLQRSNARELMYAS
jgi:ABC-2 type transport system ATP-binding protein